MTHGPTYYESKGECVYCGSRENLSDEHIVPYSLDGVHVLRDASCKRCCDITKKFELDVARNLWGDPRISYGMRSRRKKSRPKYVLIPVANDARRKLKVPYKEYPAAFVYYEMGRAGILDNAHPFDKISDGWILKAEMCDAVRRDAFLKKYGENALTMSFKHVPDSFGRLIAKIAYCQVMTQLDRNDFTHTALPYILGDEGNVSFIVGGTSCLKPLSVGYETSTCALATLDYVVIVGEVRLLASLNTPKYYAVVGFAQGQDQVKNIIKKLGSDSIRTEKEVFIFGNYQSISDIPWFPKSIPLQLS